MHEAALAKAAVPAPAVVLEMLLRPFSLGHYLLLESRLSPLLTPPLSPFESALSGELVQAVLVCSQSWVENQRLNHDFLISFKLWIWKWRIKRAAKRFIKRCRRTKEFQSATYLSLELEKFRAYLAAGSISFPLSDVIKPDRGPAPRQPGTPFVMRLQQWLMTHLQLSEAEAWDYPFALAGMRWATHWEQEGGLEIYNEHDAQFDKFVSEMEAKGAALAAKGNN